MTPAVAAQTSGCVARDCRERSIADAHSWLLHVTQQVSLPGSRILLQLAEHTVDLFTFLEICLRPLQDYGVALTSSMPALENE